MRIAEVGKLFVGSCLVYVVVAACSAYSGSDPATSSGGGGASSSGNASSTSSSGTTVVDPIGNALANGHRSGSRLKLRFWEGSDGSRQFIDFWDTQLKNVCTMPVRTSDGKDRCAPPQRGTRYYAAGCTSLSVYVVDKAVDPQPTVVPVSDGATTTYYALGALVAAPAKVYQKGDESGGCLEGVVPTGFNSYSFGAPVPDSSLVEVAAKTE